HTIRKLVVALLVLMIVTVLTVLVLFVMRFGAAPEMRLGTDFIAVQNDDQIEIYDAETGALHQTILLERPSK
ncbi:MAG: hypothetical protein AAGA63_13620, partial [Pseudomonadota bacterium]